MWYAYNREGSSEFIALSVERVKEIIAQNKKGIKVKVESEEPKDTANVESKELDFHNVVGQESLTRFDEKKKFKHHKHKNRHNNKNDKS
jgi:hypothetical protein